MILATFVVYKCFQFGEVRDFLVWLRVNNLIIPFCRGGRGRGGGGWGRGTPYGRDYDPYPPPRGRMYDRDPYDYYDRQYPRDRVPPRIPPPYDDLRRYDREDRLPPPRDPYDRYPPPRYPPPDRYPYDRLPPRPADPYDRPPPDYYRYK